MDLPLCYNCRAEVKPGEDECWHCLGELKPAEEVNFWIYGSGPGITAEQYSINTTWTTINDNNMVFTWTAKDSAEVTGMTYQMGDRYSNQSFNFKPIDVVSGDTIQFTISDILKVT